ncbi:hypothetical protein [Streptomyces sp. NPDC094144]|uniref:hypothetical protein n=1 Tax=Streptomyces sp. NPDC094144 TaxID=3366056 RepID=UPI00382CD1D9
MDAAGRDGVGTSTMALYRHVPGKAEPVRLMSEAAFGERPLGPVPQRRRTGLQLASRRLRAMYGRHPWMVQAVAPAPGMEARALQDTGLSDEEWMTRNEPQFEAVSTGGHFPVLHRLFEHETSSRTSASASNSGSAGLWTASR